MSEIDDDTSKAEADGSQGDDQYRMTVDLNVLDHLGINLYGKIGI